MVGAVILFSVGFFFLGIYGAVMLMERITAKKTMTKILEECEELYKKDYPECYIGIPGIVILGYIMGDWEQMKLK